MIDRVRAIEARVRSHQALLGAVGTILGTECCLCRSLSRGRSPRHGRGTARLGGGRVVPHVAGVSQRPRSRVVVSGVSLLGTVPLLRLWSLSSISEYEGRARLNGETRIFQAPISWNTLPPWRNVYQQCGIGEL
jgi:hypothetical protein